MSGETSDSAEEDVSSPSVSGGGKIQQALEIAKVIPTLVPESFKRLDAGLSTGVDGLFYAMQFDRLHLWSERRRLTIQRNLSDLAAEFDTIKDDDLVQAPMEMEQPILEKLAVTSDEKLSEILIKLLIAAASKSKSHLAHPSMLVVAENLSADETLILKHMARSGGRIPMIGVTFTNKNPKLRQMQVMQTNYYSELGDLYFTSPGNVDFYVGNLISLGLFESKSGYIPAGGTANPHTAYQQLSTKAEKEFSPPNRSEDWSLKTDMYRFEATKKGTMFMNIIMSTPQRPK